MWCTGLSLDIYRCIALLCSYLLHSMSLIEAQRQLLEENDALEVSVARRFRKNPVLALKCSVDQSHQLSTKKKRSHKEMLLLEHELKFFEDTYKQNNSRLREQLKSKSDLLKDIQAFKDPDMKFYLFLDAMKDLNDKRPDKLESAKNALAFTLPYLSVPADEKRPDSNKVKRKQLLSSMGAHLGQQLGLVLNDVELFGQYLDMSYFFDQYKLLVPSKDTYVDYLRKFADFPYKTSSSDEYKRYLAQLHKYLLKFYEETHPLEDMLELLKDSENRETVEEGKPNDKGEVYCKACDKLFTKESVYKGHLAGKKHIKNEKALNGDKGSTKKDTGASLERDVSKLAALLKPTVDATIDHIERRAAASERERMIEDKALAEEESEFTATDTDTSDKSDSEDDEDDDLLSKHLPLGTDGTPIPLWLYKLQGLHRSYNCEICGNVKYKGRQQYDKHFQLSKHIYGLQCLGVDDDAMVSFAGISSIDEANELWQSLKKAKRNTEQTIENAIEVEDEEGNVMPEKDYLELKKQGLL